MLLVCLQVSGKYCNSNVIINLLHNWHSFQWLILMKQNLRLACLHYTECFLPTSNELLQ